MVEVYYCTNCENVREALKIQLEERIDKSIKRNRRNMAEIREIANKFRAASLMTLQSVCSQTQEG